MHVVQLFYFAAFAAGMSIFAILGTVPMARLVKKPSLWYAPEMRVRILSRCINADQNTGIAMDEQKHSLLHTRPSHGDSLYIYI